MRKVSFMSIDEVFKSGILGKQKWATGSDRVLKSTRLEDKIYADLRDGDVQMDSMENSCTEKLSTFPALARDVYQSFYSLNVRKKDESELSDKARTVNAHILDELMGGEDYPSLKSICEGRQLPAYDAAAEFSERIADDLDFFLEKAGGDKNALNTLEKLRNHEEKLIDELSDLKEKFDADQSPELEKKLIDKANRLASKGQQVEALSAQIRDNLRKNHEEIQKMLISAAEAAGEKAEETALAMAAWGQDSDDSGPQQMKLNRDAIDKIRSSETLMVVTKYLGRFKEMLAKARKNSYAYGRGEKYTLELGNDLQRVITSEFSMLAVPAAVPLFLRKFQQKRLKQYKRREQIFKGCGDIIMCLDESGSTENEAPWGKAVALALLDAAMYGKRKFALIHYSGKDKFKTDLFLPGQYSQEDVFAAAETFLDGGTDFETPLNEAVRLISDEGFENADIVFVTDGFCELPETFREDMKLKQQALGFKITGVLLDVDSPGMEFSLTPFCDEILRTSEIARDGVMQALINKRM